jgi:hypothetical protein
MQRTSYARPLKTLRETRDGLKQQQGRIKQEIARLDRIIRQLEAMSGDAAEATPDSAIEVLTPPDLKGLSHAQAAGAVLATAAAPLSIRQLLDTFQRAGRPLSMKNGYSILFKTLRKHRQFESIGGKWRLIDHGSNGHLAS